MSDTITSYTTRLRDLADLLDAHPDLPTPYVAGYTTHLAVHWFLYIKDLDLADQKTVAAPIVGTLGGKWDKKQAGERFSFIQSGEGMTLEIVVARDAVCERVVVGSHEVTVPATAATPAEPEHTKTIDDVEWVCAPLLAQVSA